MILPSHFAKLAARGQATTALIPVRQSREARRKNGTTYTAHPWTPQPGRHEPLRTSGRKTATIAHIIIRDHRTIPLNDLLDETPDTLRLIRTTGHRTRAELADAWLRAYDTWPTKTTGMCPACEGTGILDPDGVTAGIADLATCPDCDLGEIQIQTTPTDTETLTRFKARHGNRLVHIVHFTLDQTEHLRLLSPAGKPRGDDHGYTENPSDAMSASSDPGEAVPVKVQDEFSKQARERDDQQRRDRGEGRDLRNQRRYQQRRAA